MPDEGAPPNTSFTSNEGTLGELSIFGETNETLSAHLKNHEPEFLAGTAAKLGLSEEQTQRFVTLSNTPMREWPEGLKDIVRKHVQAVEGTVSSDLYVTALDEWIRGTSF